MSEEETSEPTTSDTDLKGGIFNLVVTLVKYYEQVGMGVDQACEQVATMLESMISALRQRP